MLAIDLIRSMNHNPNGNNNLIADCREGMARIPRVHIQHCYREANKCVDALIRRGLPCYFIVFDFHLNRRCSVAEFRQSWGFV